MEHEIKKLADAVTNKHIKNLVLSHVDELHFENNHLIVYVDNAGPFHELEGEEGEHHLKSAMEKVYGEDITYEFKIYKEGIPHDREKGVTRWSTTNH
jgi:hypothetical protein